MQKSRLVNVTFPENAPANGNVVDDNFLGVSWELSALPSLCEYRVVCVLSAA